MNEDARLEKLLGSLFQAHPWHGIEPGDVNGFVNVYVEIVPSDAVKYELDKKSGQLRIDRPQRYSSLSPMPYGFIPRTYCGSRVGARSAERLGLGHCDGDGDPMDLCVLTEKPFAHGNFIGRVRPVGGLRVLDGAQADDKIVAVLEADLAYGHLKELADAPPAIVERLRHYFLTYKQLPGAAQRKVDVAEVYDAAEAREMISRSIADYLDEYLAPEQQIASLRKLIRGIVDE
jgi:inorganic pyrophosphatase